MSIPAAVAVSLHELRDLDKQKIFEDAVRLSRAENPENDTDFQLWKGEVERWQKQGYTYKNRALLHNLFAYIIIAKFRNINCRDLYALLDGEARVFVDKCLDKLEIYSRVPLLLQSGSFRSIITSEFNQVKDIDFYRNAEERDKYRTKIACLIAIKYYHQQQNYNQYFATLPLEMQTFINDSLRRLKGEYEDLPGFVGEDEESPENISIDKPWARYLIIFTIVLTFTLLTSSMMLLYLPAAASLIGGATAASIGAMVCGILSSVALAVGCVFALYYHKSNQAKQDYWSSYSMRPNNRSGALYRSGLFIGTFSLTAAFLFFAKLPALGFGSGILQTEVVNAMGAAAAYVTAGFLFVVGVIALGVSLQARTLSINAMNVSARAEPGSMRHNTDSGRLDRIGNILKAQRISRIKPKVPVRASSADLEESGVDKKKEKAGG